MIDFYKEWKSQGKSVLLNIYNVRFDSIKPDSIICNLDFQHGHSNMVTFKATLPSMADTVHKAEVNQFFCV